MKRRESPPTPPDPKGKLPTGFVFLDFEIRAGLPAAFDEWEARGAWLGFVRTHGEALAALAVEWSAGETHERAKLVAKRFRALLDQARTSRWSSRDDRLDLAAPLPEVKRWPPLFAGEPTSPEDAAIMRTPLRWDDVTKLAAWARAFAYYAMGMQWQTPPAVRAQARGRLHRLLDAAQEGLDVGETPEPAKGKRARKGGSHG